MSDRELAFLIIGVQVGVVLTLAVLLLPPFKGPRPTGDKGEQ